MAKVKQVPFYQMDSSFAPLRRAKWKEHFCVPLNAQQTVSMDRLAAGEPVPPAMPKPPKPTPEQIKERQAEEAHQKRLAEQQKKTIPKQEDKSESDQLADAEECERLPVFDMLDIPDAMQRMGWVVSAKLARHWFSGPRHIFDDNPNSVQPIDSSSVSFDWVLKFGNVREKYESLVSEKLNSDTTRKILKKKIGDVIADKFVGKKLSDFSIDTALASSDLRQFHIDWQFQRADISNYDTLDGLAMTDLTGALANFAIYVAIGRVEVAGSSFYIYDNHKNTKTNCIEPKAVLTHVYVYVKDNYSFNDKQGKTQYLGHWNKQGMVLTTGGVISDLIDGKYVHTDLGNAPKMNWDYLTYNNLQEPVDARRGLIGKLKEADVYFPIYNQSYNQWRERHRRGGDFMIYTKPKLMKLRNSIEISLDKICREPGKMN
jgi:hypothetical protein